MVMPGSDPDLVLTGRFVPSDERSYIHRPFEVPAGTHQLHVRYGYSDRIPSDPMLRGGNTLDIGIFDEQGISAGGPGFRGWSGSNQLAFTIDEAWATPPYRGGKIGAGTWNVLLGPYKVGPRGLDYRVDLWFNPGLTAEPPDIVRSGPPIATTVPPAAEPGWVRGDLHCHTRASDGDSWLLEVLVAAAEAGLDFLGVTDHNSALPPRVEGRRSDARPLLVPGIEVTTYGGHWNAWGGNGWFDFRQPTAAATEAAMRTAIESGAFVSVNHPKPFGPPWEYETVRGFHAIEVWNGPWERFNSMALASWETRLRRGERLIAIGGSDTHDLRNPAQEPLAAPRLGQPTTWIEVDGPLTPTSLLAGLQAGRCFISTSPDGPQLYLTRLETIRLRAVGACGNALLVLSDAGCVAAFGITRDDQCMEMAYPAGASYVRAQLASPSGELLAISNPIWADASQP